MFETLFTYPGVLQRHREGPLAAERAAYLNELADRGMAHGTILRRSSYCLCIALALQRWPPDRCFDEAEVAHIRDALIRLPSTRTAWKKSTPSWPGE